MRQMILKQPQFANSNYSFVCAPTTSSTGCSGGFAGSTRQTSFRIVFPRSKPPDIPLGLGQNLQTMSRIAFSTGCYFSRPFLDLFVVFMFHHQLAIILTAGILH
jgi:hypothetical protein